MFNPQPNKPPCPPRLYDGEYMRYDFKTHRYVLTLKYVTDVLGIDLQKRVNSNGAVNGQAVINRVLNTASIHVYNYVFSHNISKQCHEWIIATCPSAWEIVMQAMGEQLSYLLTVGDLSRSTKAEERENYMDLQAKSTLDQDVREIGAPLTTAIPFGFRPPCYENGGY